MESDTMDNNEIKKIITKNNISGDGTLINELFLDTLITITTLGDTVYLWFGNKCVGSIRISDIISIS